MPIPKNNWTISLLLICLSACSETLVATDNGDAGPDQLPIMTVTEDGLSTTDVDATDRMQWRYFDLESASEVFPLTPEESDEWDLAFQRFKIRTNGGSSGTGGAEVAILTDQLFEEITSAPVAPYVQDAPDGDDEGEDPDLAFLVGDGWYAYDENSHILTARPTVFVVRTPESGFFKVQILDYYDDAGTSGHVSFRWAEIDPPSVAALLSSPRFPLTRVAMTLGDPS